MSKQYLDREQMLHLKELGVEKSNSDVFWIKYVGDEYVKLKNICKCGEFLVKTKDEKSITQKVEGCEVIPAFTLQDILDILPKEIHGPFHDAKLCIYDGVIFYRYADDDHSETIAASKIESGCLIDAAYRILCDLIENGYIETRI